MARGTQVPRSRARRVTIKALVLAVLVLPAALLFLLYRPGVQVRLLAAALRKAEESTGLSLSARELSMDPLRGRLVLRGVAAAVPGSRPFLTADEAEVEIDVREGFRRRLHVRHVAAEGVRIDLSAPLPASQGTSTGDLAFLSAAEIDHIRVGISSFVSGPLPPSLRNVALGARLEKARLTGSLRGGTLTLRGDLPTVVVDRPGPLRLLAAGDVALSLTAAGRIDLEAFHLAGEGFSASACGAAGLSPDAPIALHAEVSAEPGKVAPELRTTGTLRLVADVGGSRSALSATLARRRARREDPRRRPRDRLREGTPERRRRSSSRRRVRTSGRAGASRERGGSISPGAMGSGLSGSKRLPDGLLAAYADEATRARWGIAGSELDGVATVRHGRGDPFPLSVDAELSLSRAGTVLASASAHLESRGTTTLDLSATFLPASPGERRAEGLLRAPDSRGPLIGPPRPTAGSASPAPDLAAAHAELRALFPSLVAAAPEGVDLAGGFRLDVRAAGPLRAPRADGRRRVRSGTGRFALAPREPPTPHAAPSKGRSPFPASPSAPSVPARRGSRRPTPVRLRSEAAGRPRHPRRIRPLPRRGAAAPRDAPRLARGRGSRAADRRARGGGRRGGARVLDAGTAASRPRARLSLTEPLPRRRPRRRPFRRRRSRPRRTPSSATASSRSTSRARADRASRRPSPRASRSGRCATFPPSPRTSRAASPRDRSS